MSTIAQNLAALQQAKSDIAGAITSKGGTVNSGDGFADFATDIGTIPSGGGASIARIPSSKTIGSVKRYHNKTTSSQYIYTFTNPRKIKIKRGLLLNSPEGSYTELSDGDYTATVQNTYAENENLLFKFTISDNGKSLQITQGKMYQTHNYNNVNLLSSFVFEIDEEEPLYAINGTSYGFLINDENTTVSSTLRDSWTNQSSGSSVALSGTLPVITPPYAALYIGSGSYVDDQGNTQWLYLLMQNISTDFLPYTAPQS